ncbi:MAG TPA: GNAT family N-acetyltransferase [Feifaniaceae bacterium]|nr:GNAT family N-acetyltransferase [Feifaniaceae bacterium]
MIRLLRENEYEAARALAGRVFGAYAVPEYTREAAERVDAFLSAIGTPSQESESQVQMFGCFMRNTLAGVVATRECTHICLLFVAPEYQRKGVARSLLQSVRQDAVAAEADYITVNSSPCAVPVYERLGFAAAGPEEERGGVRYTPMRYPLNTAYTLRLWRMEDAERVAELADNPGIAKNLLNAFPSPYGLEDAKTYLSRCIEAGEGKRLDRAVEVDGRAAGSVSVIPGEDVYEKSAEIGYWLGEPYWGLGIMTRAVREISELAFSKFDIVRIQAEVFSDNKASCRVLERAGYAFEGVKRCAVYKNGGIQDLHTYALVRENFQPDLKQIQPSIEPAFGALDDARALFEEYAHMLDIMIYFETFDEELNSLPGEYAPPRGRLLVARWEGEAIGCVAVRPLTKGRCELKRLYVRPAFRGMHVGRRLAEHAIQEAKGIGYKQMLLDTLDMLQDSIALFHKLGFAETISLYGPPKPGLVYMSLDLSE